ncbi:hypothetical protein K438DRAFT_1970202 [Mycena galopus ATCC 62051]|nr:hypothetical protein K438DRAFT_1970202 [Mycena galopus ATCC 62051]
MFPVHSASEAVDPTLTLALPASYCALRNDEVREFPLPTGRASRFPVLPRGTARSLRTSSIPSSATSIAVSPLPGVTSELQQPRAHAKVTLLSYYHLRTHLAPSFTGRADFKALSSADTCRAQAEYCRFHAPQTMRPPYQSLRRVNGVLPTPPTICRHGHMSRDDALSVPGRRWDSSAIASSPSIGGASSAVVRAGAGRHPSSIIILAPCSLSAPRRGFCLISVTRIYQPLFFFLSIRIRHIDADTLGHPFRVLAFSCSFSCPCTYTQRMLNHPFNRFPVYLLPRSGFSERAFLLLSLVPHPYFRAGKHP